MSEFGMSDQSTGARVWRTIQVQVEDDAATRFADELQAVDLHAEACCIRVLIRDRDDARREIAELKRRHGARDTDEKWVDDFPALECSNCSTPIDIREWLRIAVGMSA